jgi:mannosyltransferase OCH1-like enzyme
MKIPKIFHQVWLGSGPRHPKFVEWQEAWVKMHPGWIMQLWTQDGADIVCGEELVVSKHPDLLAKACHLSQRSNIWRYELLEQFGGVYLDTDMEPIKNIEPLLGDTEAFAGKLVAWLDNELQTLVSTSIFGGVAGHPWLTDLVNKMTGRDPAKRSSLGNPYMTLISKDHQEVTLLEPDVFYPKVKFGPVNAISVPATTYAVHHSSGRWWPGSYQSLLPV